LRIGELSRKTGISVRSLRYYEAKQLLKARRRENNYRAFDESAIAQVKTIQMYLGLGLSTDEIAKIIECPVTAEDRQPQPLCEKALTLYVNKLQEIEQQIELLEKIRSSLEDRVSTFLQGQLPGLQTVDGEKTGGEPS